MPLLTAKAGDCRGTETDGTKSDTWCSLCYVNGRFVDPECTLDGMVRIVDDALKRDKRSPLMRYMARKQIPRLDRWREPA